MCDLPFARRSVRLWLNLLFVAACAMPSAGAVVTAPQKGGTVAEAHVLHVGPARTFTSVAETARIARSGDTVLIDAGDYVGDVATWTQDHLTIRALAGPVRMLAAGKAAEGKAIWVIKGLDVLVEGIEFSGTRVPSHNGAGIRYEGRSLTIRNCKFYDNETGLLAWNDPSAELTIENSEFHHNGAGDGQSHNLYIGAIRRLTITGSYSHHAHAGHLLKSRAMENHVMYNRLTDEVTGHASYELEFPSGGVAYVIGNIIEQGPQTENLQMVSFGAEGYRWPRNEIFLANNTLVDDSPRGGTFVHVAAGAQRVAAINNLLLGNTSSETTGLSQDLGNVVADWREVVAPTLFDYRLRRSSALVGTAQDPGFANDVALRPTREYVHPMRTRSVNGVTYSPGALQAVGP